jgi:hypothetical protein
MFPEKLEDALTHLTDLIATSKALVKEDYDLAEGTKNAWDDNGVSAALEMVYIGIITANASFATMNKGLTWVKEALEKIKEKEELETKEA